MDIFLYLTALLLGAAWGLIAGYVFCRRDKQIPPQKPAAAEQETEEKSNREMQRYLDGIVGIASYGGPPKQE